MWLRWARRGQGGLERVWIGVCVFSPKHSFSDVHKAIYRGQSDFQSPVVMTISGLDWEKAKQETKYLPRFCEG